MFRSLLLVSSLLLVYTVQAQNLGLIEEDTAIINYTYATFKTNRVVNGHSVEMVNKRNFDFKISHRFGFMDRGLYDLFGLDGATIRLGGDYGLTDNLNIGIGRSTMEKTYDGFVKWRFLKQSSGAKVMPLTAVLIGHTGINTLKMAAPSNKLLNRMHYTTQLLLARKFSSGFSAQLSPSFVHVNLVDQPDYSNDIFVLGVGLRQKLTHRTSLNLEYFQRLSGTVHEETTNTLSLGFDIETGGHVFQLFFTNAYSPYEKGFLTDTRAKWQDGKVRMGFNIARMFTF